ncbi:MAG TPA: PEGA domain-containing protein [Anaeromyxobacteraceae bacterium]|nr:PEGA domain-containing protein [Anaeromyxobacteraceae bacterium]
MKLIASLAALLLAAPAAAETSAVLAVAEPPGGPEAELSEMTHQLRAACRDRTGGVLEVPEMRARLLGQASNATLPELERAYAGALATYQNGEYEGSIRTLYAVVEDLERLPESPEGYQQWIRALLRLAHAEGTIGHVAEARAAMEKVLAVEPRYQPDPEQFSPTYRREFDAVRAKVAARPKRSITVTAIGRGGAVFVNGRVSGQTPATVSLPAGRYRVGGAAGPLRVPSFWVELRDEDRSVVLDFSLAEALRVNAGPGLALPRAGRHAGVVRAGAWLGVDRVLATSIAVEGQVQYLSGSIYDVRRGAMMREGLVRMVAGSVPTANLGALASFLLTGQPQRAVVPVATESSSAPVAQAVEPAPAGERSAAASATSVATAAKVTAPPPAAPAAVSPKETPAAAPAAAKAAVPAGVAAAEARIGSGPPAAPPESPPAPVDVRAEAPKPPPSWMRPAAYAAGGTAVLLGGFAVWQGLTASSRYDEATAMLLPDGSFQPGADPARYAQLVAEGDSAKKAAVIGATAAALTAVAGGVLWFLSKEPPPAPGLAFRF